MWVWILACFIECCSLSICRFPFWTAARPNSFGPRSYLGWIQGLNAYVAELKESLNCSLLCLIVSICHRKLLIVHEWIVVEIEQHFPTLQKAWYSAFTDKVERNCHFPAAGWNCMTHRQAPKGFPDMSQVSLHKTIKSTCFFFSTSCRKPGCNGCVQLHQWTHCSKCLNGVDE
jgi:hypothetical protein